ncbi:MAG: hypothetical protein WC862_01430 [Patescibacteria group bacterium]
MLKRISEAAGGGSSRRASVEHQPVWPSGLPRFCQSSAVPYSCLPPITDRSAALRTQSFFIIYK